MAATGSGVVAGFARSKLAVGLAIAVALVLAAVAAVFLLDLRAGGRTVTAHFTRTVGIYPGSDVRILGVKVGEIEEVVPRGKTVRVTMNYSTEYQVPVDVKAIVVPPSLVSDRYIQLAPVYKGGRELANHATLSKSRTVVPLELDEVYSSLDELGRALGPEGANSTGELSRLLKTERKNLEGNGEQLGKTLSDFSKALDTLASGRKDLFGSISNLQKFTKVLADSDKEVRRFNSKLASVSKQLSAERDELSGALRSLAKALGHVTKFVRDNRKELVKNVDLLTDVTSSLVKQQSALIDVLDFAPVGASNLALSYNPRSGTIDARDTLMGPYDPASFVCSLMVHVLPTDDIPQACFDLAQRLHDGGAQLTPELGKLLGLSVPTPGPKGGSDKKKGPLPSGESQSSDPTFGGILGGSR
ncbi:MAG: MCE family protein [Micromonosporaceae bacterium]|nr:MCE family protein [Micromonosporaceae bacterium]